MSLTDQDNHRLETFFFGRLNFEKQQPLAYGELHFRLRPLEVLLARLGNPHHHFPIIHVAGTKGKGSVCTMLQQILTAAGYRSGLYTSPHIHHLSERFVIDGHPAKTAELRAVVEQLQPVVDQLDCQAADEPEFGKLTFFDLCTAAAFLHFSRQAVDVAVIEVGMGGRLDSTNVVQPVVSVITNVSLDHTQQLGETIAAIAREKGGIIKSRTPIISGVQQPEAKQVIQELAQSKQAALLQAGDHLTWRAAEDWQGACTVQRRDPQSGEWSQSPPLLTRLLGAHQRDNLALVFGVVEQLRSCGWKLPDAALQQGIAAARPAGRLEILSRSPWVIVDVAHNPASFAALVQTLRKMAPDRSGWQDPASANSSNILPSSPFGRRTLVFAVSRDKDYVTMLRQAAGYFDRIVLTRFHQNPRATELNRLVETATQVTDPLRPILIQSIEDPQLAFQHACGDTTGSDLVVVAGSLFLLAEIGSWSPEQLGVE